MIAAVIPNYEKPNIREYTDEVCSVLEQNGITPRVAAEGEDIIGPDCDVVIVIGGDGTIIHNAKQAAVYGRPVLGINTGRLGFMAGLEVHELAKLSALRDGSYRTEMRMMLDAEIISGGVSEHCTALNDIVLTRSATSRIADISVSCNGAAMSTYRSDGIIISTPTGSTAYAISAGGPVIDPLIESIMITPVCPHSLFSRSVLLSASTVLELTCDVRPGSEVYLITDGEQSVKLSGSERIRIKKSAESFVQLIKIKDDSFYNIFKSKMRDRIDI